MSDFDRNVASARPYGADRAVAVDAGLRAYMISVYNTMAVGVALTGLVAWFTFQMAGGRPIDAGAITGADVVRAGDVQHARSNGSCYACRRWRWSSRMSFRDPAR